MTDVKSAVEPVVGRRWWALVAMALLLVSVGLDLTILNVALPSLAVDLNATSTDLQWIVNAYAVVMASTLLPAGRLGDRIGPRALIIAAALLFAIASGMCAWAGSTAWLIVARALLGGAAGVFMPLSMSMLTRLFHGAERSRAISVWTAAVALGIPAGPLLGGWLLDHFWWGSVFVINVPVAAVAVVLLIATLPAVAGQRAARIDVVGVVLSTVAFVALTFGFTRAGDTSWSGTGVLVPIALGVLAVAALAVWLNRAPNPLFSLDIFGSPQFLWGCVTASVASLVMMTTIFIVPQYAQLAAAGDAFDLGLRLLPFIGGLVFAVPVSEALIKRFGYKVVVVLGFLVMAAGTALAACTGTGSSTGYLVLWSAVAGAGVGFVLPNSMDLAMSAMDDERSGVGSGIVQSLRQLGGTMGVAVLGTLLVTAYRDRLDLTDLPAQAADAVRSSPAGGAVVAERSQHEVPQLLDMVRSGFVTGMDRSFAAMCVICVIGALVAAWRVPREVGENDGAAGAF
ncbi:MFS transporter [Streptomyces sp. NPDC092296]|uniref:MFS transporter n=1 Tax=Streptomyces sp. NPDC092296 TaxID=3366012 RepID=UPI0038165ED0